MIRDAKNRELDFIETTMQVVAETGLTAFSMKKVTNRLKVGETLIYKYFETKDKLLYRCFETTHMQIAALFDRFAKESPPPIQTPREAYLAVRELWMMYFSFLVQNSYRTLFYFEYRDSPYIHHIRVADEQVRRGYFKGFAKIIYAFDEQFHIFDKTTDDHLWTYILDVTGIFAKRVIRGELPDTEKSRENIWRLISAGLLGLFE